MKNQTALLRILTAALLCFSTILAGAADRLKANNSDALNQASSWIGGVPGSGDLAIFDFTLDAAPKTNSLGAATTWGGISFRDAQAFETITGNLKLTLADAGSGIEMTSAATNNLNIGCQIGLGTAGQTFSVVNADRTLTISNIISGTGPLTKTGSGTLKVSTVHTYTGGTIVDGGTLQLGSANTLPAGTVSVHSGATLDLNAFWLTNKAYQVHIAGTGLTNGGAVAYNSGSQRSPALTNLVLDADASIGGAVRFDIGPASGSTAAGVDLGGHTLTKTRGNVVFFTSVAPIASGSIVIEGGVLGLTAATITSGSSLAVRSGAELRLFRNNSQQPSALTCPITLDSGSLLNYINQNTIDAIDQSIASPITLSGDSTLSVGVAGAVLEITGPITGSAAVTKTGPGTLWLSGPSTYTGNTVVSNGLLSLSTAWSGSVDVAVQDGAALEVRIASAGSFLRVNNLTLGNAGLGATNTFDLGGFANPAGAAVVVTNALVVNGPIAVNLAGASALTNGTFKLFQFGSISGSGGFQVGVTPGFTATLATNGGNNIEITVTKLALVWRGDTNGMPMGDWVPGDPSATNWLDTQANTRTTFADGNVVRFDDSLTGTAAVNVPGPVAPSSVTISNNTAAYTLSGLGKITGSTGLTKTGTGTVVLTLNNDYTGPTTIAQGLVQLGYGDALPTNSSSPALTVDGVLDMNGRIQTISALSGSGTVTNSMDSAPVVLTILGVGISGNFSGRICDSANASVSLLKKGGSTQTFSGPNTFSGGININGGTVLLGSAATLGIGTVTLSYQGTLASDSASPRTVTNAVEFVGSSTMTLGNQANSGLLTFSGPISFGGSGARSVSMNSDVLFSGTVDNGALTKYGNGTWIMNGVGTYLGNTLIQAGTLSGNGSLAGLVQIFGGAVLSPGTGIGTLTLTSNLFLNATSTTDMEVNAANGTCDLIQGLAKVTYNGTLQVTNVSGTPTNGQVFQLFSSVAVTGTFAATNLPPLATDLMWVWNPANGTLSVAPAIASAPTNISFSVSAGNLTLTWPDSHKGWILQSNSVSVADPAAWFGVPGSELANSVTVELDPMATNVFYRLRKP